MSHASKKGQFNGLSLLLWKIFHGGSDGCHFIFRQERLSRVRPHPLVIAVEIGDDTRASLTGAQPVNAPVAGHRKGPAEGEASCLVKIVNFHPDLHKNILYNFFSLLRRIEHALGNRKKRTSYQVVKLT